MSTPMTVQMSSRFPPEAPVSAQTATARADLLRMINGFQVSQAIHVVATLRLADLMGSGPKSAGDLALATDTNRSALHRLLRALASVGIFEERNDGRFALTQMGEFLRSDIVGTHASMAELVGRKYFWDSWGDLLHAIRVGTTAFEHMHGRNVWEYRAQNREECVIFDRAMASGTERYADAVIGVCNFGRFDHIVDVGGGDGVFLAKILTAHTHIRGTVFDQPDVSARARSSLDELGLSGRCATVGGDFFAEVPQGDAHLLKWILHDWDDAACIEILRSCRKAMRPNGHLLVVEHVIGPPNTGRDGKFMDLTMMVLTGGRERTREQFSALFAEAGFRLQSVQETATPLCIIEGALA